MNKAKKDEERYNRMVAFQKTIEPWRPPTMRELKTVFEVGSICAVSSTLKRLEKNGLVVSCTMGKKKYYHAEER